MKPIVALYGGIASGKSTARAMWQDLNPQAKCIDSDGLVHAILDTTMPNERSRALLGKKCVMIITPLTEQLLASWFFK